MTLPMYLASLAWALLVLGFFSRAKRSRHVALMLSGITLDFTLVLYLEFTRSAVEKALEFSLGFLPQLHIGFSTTALILYIPTLISGIRMYRGNTDPILRKWHLRIAQTALACRTVGFGLMFSLIK